MKLIIVGLGARYVMDDANVPVSGIPALDSFRIEVACPSSLYYPYLTSGS